MDNIAYIFIDTSENNRHCLLEKRETFTLSWWQERCVTAVSTC